MLVIIIMIIMIHFRLGFLIDFISQPVIAGFTSGAALTIASGQIKVNNISINLFIFTFNLFIINIALTIASGQLKVCSPPSCSLSSLMLIFSILNWIKYDQYHQLPHGLHRHRMQLLSHNTHYNTYVFPQSLLGIAVDKDHKSHLHAGVVDYYVDIVNKWVNEDRS